MKWPARPAAGAARRIKNCNIVVGTDKTAKTALASMVPQQQDSPSSSGQPTFGSLLVDKNSSTPYSDATQVIFTPTIALYTLLQITQTSLTTAFHTPTYTTYAKFFKKSEDKRIACGYHYCYFPFFFSFPSILPGSLLGRGRWRRLFFSFSNVPRGLFFLAGGRLALKLATGNSAAFISPRSDLDLEKFTKVSSSSSQGTIFAVWHRRAGRWQIVFFNFSFLTPPVFGKVVQNRLLSRDD